MLDVKLYRFLHYLADAGGTATVPDVEAAKTGMARAVARKMVRQAGSDSASLTNRGRDAIGLTRKPQWLFRLLAR